MKNFLSFYKNGIECTTFILMSYLSNIVNYVHRKAFFTILGFPI
jgi:hypothetical protein